MYEMRKTTIVDNWEDDEIYHDFSPAVSTERTSVGGKKKPLGTFKTNTTEKKLTSALQVRQKDFLIITSTTHLKGRRTKNKEEPKYIKYNIH